MVDKKCKYIYIYVYVYICTHAYLWVIPCSRMRSLRGFRVHSQSPSMLAVGLGGFPTMAHGPETGRLGLEASSPSF